METTTMTNTNITLTDQETAIIIAALRQWQDGTDADLMDIATNGGEYGALDDAQIDALCERINFAETATPAPYSRWLGNDAGNLSAVEMRLLRQSLRLQPRDISDAMINVGRDCPPSVVKKWEQNSQWGPPEDVCDLLWACDKAVEGVVVATLDLAHAAQCLPERRVYQAEAQFEGRGLALYKLSQEALQALQVAAWDRAMMVLRALGVALTYAQAGDHAVGPKEPIDL